MKRSQSYYLKRLSICVEKLRSGESVDVQIIPADTRMGMQNVFNQYLERLWMNIGDTAFNRANYRCITDYLFEQLEEIA